MQIQTRQRYGISRQLHARINLFSGANTLNLLPFSAVSVDQLCIVCQSLCIKEQFAHSSLRSMWLRLHHTGFFPRNGFDIVAKE